MTEHQSLILHHYFFLIEDYWEIVETETWKISIQAMKMPENQRDENLFCGKDSPYFRNSCGDVVCFHQRREAVGGRFLVLEEKAHV